MIDAVNPFTITETFPSCFAITRALTVRAVDSRARARARANISTGDDALRPSYGAKMNGKKERVIGDLSSVYLTRFTGAFNARADSPRVYRVVHRVVVPPFSAFGHAQINEIPSHRRRQRGPAAPGEVASKENIAINYVPLRYRRLSLFSAFFSARFSLNPDTGPILPHRGGEVGVEEGRERERENVSHSDRFHKSRRGDRRN